jgi:phosphoribosylformylglycinamidine synthase
LVDSHQFKRHSQGDIMDTDGCDQFQLHYFVGESLVSEGEGLNHSESNDMKSSHYCYWVWLDARQQTADTFTLLSSILPQSRPCELSSALTANDFWVLPRRGTLSPWASKANDILHRCGLTEVVRVERGVKVSLHQTVVGDLLSWYDPLTQAVLKNLQELSHHLQPLTAQKMQTLPVLKQGAEVLQTVNRDKGLALSELDIDYLTALYQRLDRDPTDVEIMMFAQVNSEHCRHKIFNASWTIEGERKSASLFDLIKTTHQGNPTQVRVAYNDNAAVMFAHPNASLWRIDPESRHYLTSNESLNSVFKVETHNHPTAISPFPGAATGSGGEIRDEAATGRGATPKAGLCGYSVSQLALQALPQPWELSLPVHPGVASSLDIMLEAPVGAAAFNNEFGRPNIGGYFRTFLVENLSSEGKEYRGYHKPIMIAGGVGMIRDAAVMKNEIQSGNALVVLGGPSFAIGLGGGAASSRSNIADNRALDFASVQRANPEMQRRCQEVINACWSLDDKNPIVSVHDVGAGGLSNALPELVAASGGVIDLGAIPCADHTLSPLEIWCNESQERYVLAIDNASLKWFESVCERERCPFAVVGFANDSQQFKVQANKAKNTVVDLGCADLFEKMPKLQRSSCLPVNDNLPFSEADISLKDAIKNVLQLPVVASKRFLIHIADRSVGGLVAQDQCVGPWQVPVSDVAVTLASFQGVRGEAMTMSERAPLALIDAKAAARMTAGEALTNLLAAPISDLRQIIFSANWMAAADHLNEGAALYQAVEALTQDVCIPLGIAIPVGKDSLSMKSEWQAPGDIYQVTSPVSLVLSGVAPVDDVRQTLTPQLRLRDESVCFFIDLAKGHQSMAGSALAQVTQQIGQNAPDVRDIGLLSRFAQAKHQLCQQGLLLAYHDRSDGGLLATLSEMMFAGHAGLSVDISSLSGSVLSRLFNEELGVVLQVRQRDIEQVKKCLEQFECWQWTHTVAVPNGQDEITITDNGNVIYQAPRTLLHAWWGETSYRIQALRDNPVCAQQEFENIQDVKDPGLNPKILPWMEQAPFISTSKPQVAVLREQGVNGHMEMAAAFASVGFETVDVHMSDLLAGKTLDNFNGLVACGGFSYGDVLGAGRGWAQVILNHEFLRQQFQTFFERDSTFTLGVCNGCQMLSHLQSLIPGACWPHFERNLSQQFEARLSLVQVRSSASLFFQGMEGAVLPVVVSHGEGRIATPVVDGVNLRYVDHYHRMAERYPFNPNGSEAGVTGLCSEDGRVTIMMPHPERVYRREQFSWCPDDWLVSPWQHFFANAAKWCK